MTAQFRSVARARRVVDGVLLLDKPIGITSNGALQQLKRLFRARSAGHTGTLDPLASGLLPLCFGEATKFASELLEARKSYRATVRLGEKTTTGDAEGETLLSCPVRCEKTAIESVLARFRGEIEQVPPMYSALKHEGQPLYSYARRGETIARAPRRVRIFELVLVDLALPDIVINVICSKGTYIRVLAEDIGTSLGVGAHLRALVRTSIGPFELEQAFTPDRVAALLLPDDALLPIDALVLHLPRVDLQIAEEGRFLQGRSVGRDHPVGLRVRVYGAENRFLGIGLTAEGGSVRPKRIISTSSPA
ncbi:MAG: tRNA pseudouridine(55) synthase TruB [Betaproteobacteria bacterium]|nr:tRNA pseudouridine(55) synthase TruB [Betaproteobacteria bacterium]